MFPRVKMVRANKTSSPKSPLSGQELSPEEMKEFETLNMWSSAPGDISGTRAFKYNGKPITVSFGPGKRDTLMSPKRLLWESTDLMGMMSHH
jgi:hypothetical protein